ncbi:MAG: CPBP family intramembrane glutamic endopeptidase, partial [Pseudomonadota bacterium]
PDVPLPILALSVFLALIAAPIAGVLLFKKAVPSWFSRHFGWFFWVSTIAFALVHLANYQQGPLPLLLVLVIPQFVAGTIFGYARVHYGLWSSILLHALHNGAALALSTLATGALLAG